MSSRFRQIKDHLRPRPNGSRVTLPSIFPAPPREQDLNRSCCQENFSLPALLPRIEHGRRQGLRTWKKKDRDANYWRRVHESPSLNEEEKLLTKLKGIDGLPWKEIVVKFNEKMKLNMRQPALQMRLTRLADRMDSLWAQESPPSVQDSDCMSPPQHLLPPHLPHPQVDPLCLRDGLILPQIGFTNTAQIPGPVLWSGVTDNSNFFITNMSPISHISDTLAYEYHTDYQSGHRHTGYSHHNCYNNNNPGPIP